MLQRRCVLKRHMCNFFLHHVQRQFAPCLLGNFCNAKYAQCYVTFRQTPEICLKMLTAVAFWGIFCNYTILTMLSVSTTIINLLQILFKDFFYYRILSVQQRRWVLKRHMCNFVLHHASTAIRPLYFRHFSTTNTTNANCVQVWSCAGCLHW